MGFSDDSLGGNLRYVLRVVRQLGLALAIAAGMTNAVNGARLQKLWRVNVDGATSGTLPKVFALSFSPDGQRILAVVGQSWREEFVVIMEANDPQAPRRRLDINPMIWEQEPSSWFPLAGSEVVRWSPTGQQVLLGRAMVKLSNGSSCSLPEATLAPGYFFLGPAQIVGRAANPRRLSFFNLDCQLTATSDLHDDWNIFDASADRGQLCIRQSRAGSDALRSVLVMKADTNQIVRSLPWLITAQFADGGKAVCGVSGPEWHHTVSCSDDTGKEFGGTAGWGAVDVRTALYARRAVLSDYGRRLDWIDFFWALGSLKRRVVWDFETGKELVSWHPKSQVVTTGDHQYSGHKEPYLRNFTQSDQRLHLKAISDFTANRSPFASLSDQRFHGKPITFR
jgi:hypothetical protein